LYYGEKRFDKRKSQAGVTNNNVLYLYSNFQVFLQVDVQSWGTGSRQAGRDRGGADIEKKVAYWKKKFSTRCSYFQKTLLYGAFFAQKFFFRNAKLFVKYADKVNRRIVLEGTAMEVGNVHNIGQQKADKTGEAAKVRQQAANAYAKAEVEGNDSVSVSPKAKLLHGLTEKYESITERTAELQALKEKVQNGSYQLSAEEIVSSILKGTLFDVI